MRRAGGVVLLTASGEPEEALMEVDSLVPRMTLDEKLQLLADAIESLGG